MKAIKTRWCIITGAPSSGKTTLINALSIRGFHTAPEVARAYLSYLLDRGMPEVAEHKGDEEVQNKILSLQLARESCLDPEELIFFDRGLPDSLAYYQYYQLQLPSKLAAMIALYQYAKVFFLEGLPIQKDAIRQESSEEAEAIGKAIYTSYEKLGYKVQRIPALSVDQRLSLILEALGI